MIEVRDLHKNYQNIEAVRGIDFTVKEGSFFAFLGENGAGKSTTINIITTLVKKTSGEVKVNSRSIDCDDRLVRKDIGVVFQGNMLDKYLTVRENIMNRGSLYGLSKRDITKSLEELSGKIGITDFLDRRYGRLSGGQKRRADIVRALIHKPRILILDEPTTGLDPFARKCVWEAIKQLNLEKNLTVFLTTHYMEEAAGADYIVIIDSGSIKAAGTPEQLRLKYSSDRLILLSKEPERTIHIIEDMGYPVLISKEQICVALTNCFDSVRIIEETKEQLEGFEVIRGNMDDVFLNVTGRKEEVAVYA